MKNFFEGGRGLCYLKRLSHLFRSKNNRSLALFSFVLSLICVLFSDAQAQPAGERAVGKPLDPATKQLQYDFNRFPKIRYNTDSINNLSLDKLKIGDTIPDALWDLPLWIVYPNGNDDTVKLESFRDKKLLILDFWAVWCSPCVASIEKFHTVPQIFDDRVALLPVHLDFDYKALPFLKQRQWKTPSFIGKEAFILQRYFFDQVAAGGVVWIVDGVLRSIEYENERNIKLIPSILDGAEVSLTSQ